MDRLHWVGRCLSYFVNAITAEGTPLAIFRKGLVALFCEDAHHLPKPTPIDR